MIIVILELTGNNFPAYEKLNMPMVMLFLDLSDRHQIQVSTPLLYPFADTITNTNNIAIAIIT